MLLRVDRETLALLQPSLPWLRMQLAIPHLYSCGITVIMIQYLLRMKEKTDASVGAEKEKEKIKRLLYDLRGEVYGNSAGGARTAIADTRDALMRRLRKMQPK